MQWEYYVKDFKFDENQMEGGFPNKLEHDDLSHLGNAGWELINIVSYRSNDNELCLRYYYKKAKKPNWKTFPKRSNRKGYFCCHYTEETYVQVIIILITILLAIILNHSLISNSEPTERLVKIKKKQQIRTKFSHQVYEPMRLFCKRQ